MLYAIISQDVDDSLALRKQVRSAHIERLNTLRDEGRLILAGPFPAIDSAEPGDSGVSGSLIVAEFNSLSEATSWADADPYKIVGAYSNVTVKPFKKVLP